MRRGSIHSSKLPAAAEDRHTNCHVYSDLMSLGIRYFVDCGDNCIIICNSTTDQIRSDVSGNDNLVKNTAKYDILSLDDGSQCGVWSSLSFETFELLVF